MQRFSAILAIITLVLLASTANADICNSGIGGTSHLQDGIGGTGQQAHDGIGGTGIQASESGIGGTGQLVDEGIGGTGIVGVITGFASVCVNGLEVHYDKQTIVDEDGQSSSIGALDVGQVVAIESTSNNNQFKAKRISVSHAIIGKIEKINLAQNTIEIMGKTIKVNPNTIGLKGLKLNQVVKLSGLISSNELVALRLDPTTSTPSLISGVVDKSGKINGVKVANVNASLFGTNVQVKGGWDGNVLQATQVKESATQRVLNTSTNVVIQGIAPQASQKQFVFQNQVVNIDANTKINGANSNDNQTVIVKGKIDSTGTINARTIEYVAEDKILERGGSKQHPNALKIEKSPSVKEHNKHKFDSHEKSDVTDGPEKVDSMEKPEKIEKPEKVEKPEKIEKPEKVEKPEKIEKPEKVEKPENIERPEIPDR